MKPIRTYQSLGRFIIERVYLSFMRRCNGATSCDDLKYTRAEISRPQLEKEVKYCIEKILVENPFAMHKYAHSASKSPRLYTYRWENVMNFYIGTQIEAQFLDIKIDLNNGDCITLTDKAIDKLLDGAKGDSFFNDARKILKQKYEKERTKTR